MVTSPSALANITGRKHTITNFQFWNCYKEADATETSYLRFNNAPATLQGANWLMGNLPGRDPVYPTKSIDYGVDMRQPYNRITGVKGRNGRNVKLATGIACFVDLGGSNVATTNAACGAGGEPPR